MKNAESSSEKDLSVLEQYWKAVRDNPSDFTGWTYLLQYVEQEVRSSVWLPFML